MLLSACRGKLMDVKPSAALGPLSDWTVPQSWFGHFYALGAAWNILVTTLFLSSSYYHDLSPTSQVVYCAALVLLEVHLVRRLLETIGLMKYPVGSQMHGVAYLFGISYYLVVPLTVLPDGAFVSIGEVIANEGAPGAILASVKEMAVPSPKLLTALNWAVREN